MHNNFSFHVDAIRMFALIISFTIAFFSLKGKNFIDRTIVLIEKILVAISASGYSPDFPKLKDALYDLFDHIGVSRKSANALFYFFILTIIVLIIYNLLLGGVELVRRFNGYESPEQVKLKEDGMYEKSRACLEDTACVAQDCLFSYLSKYSKIDNLNMLVNVAKEKIKSHACILSVENDKNRRLSYMCGNDVTWHDPDINYDAQLVVSHKNPEIHISTSYEGVSLNHNIYYDVRLNDCGIGKWTDADEKHMSDLPFRGGHIFVEKGGARDFIFNQENYVRFREGSYELGKKATDDLDKVASWLEKYPKTYIIIEGHSSNEFGKSLDSKRSLAVADYLIKMGVSSSRIKLRNLDVFAPLANCNDPQCNDQNRRVVILVTRKLPNR